ncbi:MAG: type III pantothenate kinase [Pseudomonadota bacterium]
MTALLVDLGNSRAKWGLWRDGAVAETGALHHVDSGEAAHWRFADGVEQVLACSVAGVDTNHATAAAIERATGVEAVFAETSEEARGVRCGYADPSRLGIDRWMAVLAVAAETDGPALAVDAGTALTVDAVVDAREHLGGFIVPGHNLMSHALTSRTAGIRVDVEQAPELQFGQSTSAAVINGALLALCGTVQQSLALLSAHAGVATDAIVCRFAGGDGQALAEALDRGHEYRPHLVLDGLAAYGGLAA